ncbi:MAG: NADH:flavin oxidoreductase [Erysipelotrichaceae bacterium]|nr:NADH:flavin oxidoreductase [Erysipelotrichaceae bacterium]
MLDHVFSPCNIGTMTVPNRLIVPAMVMNLCTDDGILTERFIKYHEEKAKGGWGMIITEDYMVSEHAKGYEFIPGLYNDKQIEGNKRLTDIIHQYDSKIVCQIYHPGRQSKHAVNGNVQPIAPSAIKDPFCLDLPREMTREEIHEVVRDFGSTARRVKESGFDGVEIHAAHGYLISSFLSPFTNKRTDEYGGCFENRTRILKEIIEAVRENVGKDFPVIVRISSNEFLLGGRTEADSYELVSYLEELGVDAIHVSNGMYASPVEKQIIAPMYTKHALNADVAGTIKQLVSIPVIVTNRINSPKMAEAILKLGKADFVGMGRGSLADPYLPKKAKEGKFENIRYCIGCLQGCEAGLLAGNAATCLVNPRVAREYENPMNKTENPKNVMIIGGGPAGLIAAETAALIGHHVKVYEAEETLGGQFRSAAYPLGKGELSTFVSSLAKSLNDLNVPVYTGTAVTEEMIENEKPDAVIIATGAKPLHLNIPGIDGANVMYAEDVLLGKTDVNDGPIVVCGGGEVGGETAHYLTQTNHDITLIEMQNDILNDMMPLTRSCLVDYIHETGIKVITGAKVSEITDNAVIYTDKDGNKVSVPAATVVSAFGYKAYNPLEEAAKKHCAEVYTIGGAIKAGNALTAVREGYEAALKL